MKKASKGVGNWRRNHATNQMRVTQGILKSSSAQPNYSQYNTRGQMKDHSPHDLSNLTNSDLAHLNP